MLMSLRQAVHKKAVKYLIFGVLILSFGMWGIADIFIPSSDYNETVMTAGEREFTYAEVEQSFRRELRALRIDARTADNAILRSVLDYTLQRLAIGALNSQEIASLKIAGDRLSVLQNIRNNVNFYDGFGNFDERLFRQFLAVSGLSEQDYTALIAEDLGAQYWLSGLQASVAVPQSLARIYGEYLRQVRTIAYVEVAYDKVAQADFNDSDLRTYYDDNEENYRIEERRDFALIDITPETLAAEITPSEDDIRKLYDSGAYSDIEPERRDISFIVFDDKTSADEAYGSLRAGGTLADVAASASRELQNLQNEARADIADTVLADKAFGLSGKGDIAEVFEGTFGWVVLQVDGIEAAKVASFEDVRDEITADILTDRATDVIYQKAQDLEDAISAGATLAEAAERIGVAMLSKSNFDDLPPNIIAEAFNLETGEISTLLEHPSRGGALSGFFMLEVQSIEASHIADFADVKSRVKQDLLRYRQQETLRESAAQAKTGVLDLQAFAVLWGGQVQRAEVSLSSAANNGDYPQALNSAEFRNNAKGYIGDFIGDDALIVAQLESVRLQDLENSEVGENNTGTYILSRLMQNMVVSAYENFLRKKYKITYNRSALDGLILGENRLAGQG